MRRLHRSLAVDSDMKRYVNGKQLKLRAGEITKVEYEILMWHAGAMPYEQLSPAAIAVVDAAAR